MKWRVLAFLLILAVLVVGADWLSQRFNVHEIADHEQELRAAIERSPGRAVAIGFLVDFALCLVPGTSGKAIVTGWLFGFWPGLLIMEMALVLAATMIFTITRAFAAGYIRQRWKHWTAHLDRHVARDGAFYLLTLRLLHAPYTAINYISAASNISTWTFVWTTAVGMLPGTVVFVFLGSRLPTLHELAEHGPRSLVKPWLIVALMATGALPYLLRRATTRLMRGRTKSTSHSKITPEGDRRNGML